jgi:hypothetical protein
MQYLELGSFFVFIVCMSILIGQSLVESVLLSHCSIKWVYLFCTLQGMKTNHFLYSFVSADAILLLNLATPTTQVAVQAAAGEIPDDIWTIRFLQN